MSYEAGPQLFGRKISHVDLRWHILLDLTKVRHVMPGHVTNAGFPQRTERLKFLYMTVNFQRALKRFIANFHVIRRIMWKQRPVKSKLTKSTYRKSSTEISRDTLKKDIGKWCVWWFSIKRSTWDDTLFSELYNWMDGDRLRDSFKTLNDVWFEWPWWKKILIPFNNIFLTNNLSDVYLQVKYMWITEKHLKCLKMKLILEKAENLSQVCRTMIWERPNVVT